MTMFFKWLNNTFTTRQRVEEWLRPETESGVLTYHDFELSKEFLPGPHRYWHVRPLRRHPLLATQLTSLHTFLASGIRNIASNSHVRRDV